MQLNETVRSLSGGTASRSTAYSLNVHRLVDDEPLARTWPDAVASAGRARIALRRISGIMLDPPFELPRGPGFLGYLGAGARLGDYRFNIVVAVFADNHAVLRVLERPEIVAEATPATLVRTIFEIGERIARERAHERRPQPGSIVSPVLNPPPPPDVLHEAARLAAKVKAESRSP